MVNWEDLKYFDAVARCGSARKAAADMGVNPSTVTRRVEQLERHLGVRLFSRTRRGLELTPDGAVAAEGLQDVAARLQSVADQLDQQVGSVRGEVRCSVPDYLPIGWWMPELAKLALEYPHLVVTSIESNRVPDLTSKEADLALIAAGEPPQALIARPLGQIVFAPYRHNNSRNEAWLGSALEAAVAPGYAAGARATAVLPSVALQLAAVEAGMGGSLLPCAVVDGHAGFLRDESRPEVILPLWLLLHPDSRPLVRVQVVADALTDAVRAGVARSAA
ncbi:MAG: LysR family transcriptional regulator [Pseudomonadales bacterium]|nr:LysR family transcriptional regulator [Pseudomonadales bacterium]NIX08044.1 LysR family transcriptional regulator [Pseudomonadales bacterium]